MKKQSLIIGMLFVSSLFIGSCKVFEQKKQKEAIKKEFTVKDNVVLYREQPFAQLQAITWSLDGGELVKEFNFKLVDKHDLSIIGGMIDFLSERHQSDEIEVEFQVDNQSENFKL